MGSTVVIARAFRGEPLRRVVVNIGDKVVYLANPDFLDLVNSGESSPVGFPREDVYRFDSTLFSTLEAEWKSDKAAALWGQLIRFGPEHGTPARSRNDEAAN